MTIYARLVVALVALVASFAALMVKLKSILRM